MHKEYIINTKEILSLNKQPFKDNKLSKVTVKQKNISSKQDALMNFNFNYYLVDALVSDKYEIKLNNSWDISLYHAPSSRKDENGEYKRVLTTYFEIRQILDGKYKFYRPREDKMKIERDVLITKQPLTSEATSNIVSYKENGYISTVPNANILSTYFPYFAIVPRDNPIYDSWDTQSYELITNVQVCDVWYKVDSDSIPPDSEIDFYKYYNTRLTLLGANYETTSNELVSFGESDTNVYSIPESPLYTNTVMDPAKSAIARMNAEKIYNDYKNGKDIIESEIIYSSFYDENNNVVIDKTKGDFPRIGDIVRIYDSKNKKYLFEGKKYRLTSVEMRYNGIIKILIKGKEV